MGQSEVAAKIIELNEDERISNMVINRIKQDYYLVPKKITWSSYDSNMVCEYVVQFVADYMDVPPSLIKSKKRKNDAVMGRHYVCWLIKKFCKKIVTYEIIGKFLGGKDHSTTMHSLGVVSKITEVDKKFRDEVELMEIAFSNKFNPKKFIIE